MKCVKNCSHSAKLCVLLTWQVMDLFRLSRLAGEPSRSSIFRTATISKWKTNLSPSCHGFVRYATPVKTSNFVSLATWDTSTVRCKQSFTWCNSSKNIWRAKTNTKYIFGRFSIGTIYKSLGRERFYPSLGVRSSQTFIQDTKMTDTKDFVGKNHRSNGTTRQYWFVFEKMISCCSTRNCAKCAEFRWAFSANTSNMLDLWWNSDDTHRHCPQLSREKHNAFRSIVGWIESILIDTIFLHGGNTMSSKGWECVKMQNRCFRSLHQHPLTQSNV